MERPTRLLWIRTAPTTTLGHISTVPEMTYFRTDSSLKLTYTLLYTSNNQVYYLPSTYCIHDNTVHA